MFKKSISRRIVLYAFAIVTTSVIAVTALIWAGIYKINGEITETGKKLGEYSASEAKQALKDNTYSNLYYLAKLMASGADMGLTPDMLGDMLSGLTIGETGYAFFVDGLGNATVYSGSSGLQPERNLFEGSFYPLETAQRIINGESGIEQIVLDGKEKYIAYHPLSNNEGSFAFVADAHEVSAPSNLIENNINKQTNTAVDSINETAFLFSLFVVLIHLVIIAATMLFSSRLAKTVVKPIQKLIEDAVIIEKGNLDYTLEAKTDDELKILAESFNSMIASIKSATAEKERADERAQAAGYSQRILQFILDSLPVAVGIISVKNFEQLYKNGALAELFMLDSADETTEFDMFLHMPAIQPDGRETRGLFIEMNRHGRTVEELQFVKQNGDIFFARITASIIYYMGQPATLTTIENITAEKEYKQMLDFAPFGAHFWDERMNIADCNQTEIDIFRVGSKQEYIKRFYELMPEIQPNGQES
ncbi:MAG: HAMP domain-containing protein, partial [Defluviitaleaceae bacterium]|nr:HAMP domain-containing protein [Defluviitaleaceae bacterium]